MTYPRLNEGIAVAWVTDGCLAMGGSRPELFTGRAARELFPRLLPLLDGTRSTEQLAATLQIPAVHLQRVVDLFRERNLLHVRREPRGRDDQPAGEPMPVFLRRCVPGGRGAEFERRLQAARVRVTGSTPLAGLVADLLARSGVGRVERGTGDPAAPLGTLVVAVAGPDAVFDAPGDGTPWLPVHHAAGEVRVGPLLNVAGAVCAHCLAVDLDGDAPAGRPDPAQDAAMTGIAAGVATGVALRYLAGPGTPPRTGRVQQRVVPLGQPREHRVPRRAGCAGCEPADPAAVVTGSGDELWTGAPAGGWDLDRLDPAAPQRQILAKPYATEPRSTGGSVGTAFARVLARGVGSVRARRAGGGVASPRWAPSIAVSGSTHAYVLGDIDEAGPGVYYFDGRTHEFVRLPGWPGPVPEGSLSVVLTGDIAALSPELGASATRASYQDAGIATAQLHTSLRAAGWRARARPCPIPDLARLLELDPGREVIATVIDVDRRHPGAEPDAGQRAPRDSRPPMTYEYADRPVSAAAVANIVDACRLLLGEHWAGDPGPELSCLLYARQVRDLPVGLYRARAGSAPAPLPARGEGLDHVESYLRDRGICPPALLLFTGSSHPAPAASHPDGYPALLLKAAAAGGFARLAAARAGLGSGLIARAPADLAYRALDDRAGRHRLWFSCAIGYPDADGPRTRVERVIW